jgi:nitrogen fixation protein
MATIIKIVYDVTNPVIKVTYDVTNITVAGNDIAPVYISLDYSSSSAVTVITSVGLTMPTGFSVANSPLTSSGTLAVTYSSGYSLPTTTKQSEWDQAYNDKINSASVTGTSTKTLTLNQQDGGTIQASWSDIDTGLTSVGLSMPSAFSVSNSPLTANGTISVTGSGTTLQYVRGDGSLATFPALTGYVPYTGATTNVDLGEYELKAGQLTLDVSPTGTAAVGTTRWNNTIGSSETTLKGGNVILKNGVDLVARVVNKVSPNTTLTKAAYQAVRVSGAQGQRLAVAFAQANNDNNSADTIGLVTETIATNQEGFIITVGQLEGVNTTGSLQGENWTDGDVLYLSPTTPGAITNVKPIAPQHLVIIGYVEYAHQNNGKIYVKVMNGWELGELHDVTTAGATNGQVLKYNGTIWEPSSDTGITSLNSLTATSQSFAVGTSGTDFAISSSTSTHTFNLPTASSGVRGALSSADWTTFNNKPSVNIYTGNGTLTGNRTVTMGSYTLTFDSNTFVGGKLNVGTSTNYGNTITAWTASGTDALRFTDGSSAGFLYVDAGGAGVFSGAALTKQGIYFNNSTNSVVFYVNGGLQGLIKTAGTLQFYSYGLGTVTGTAAYNISVDANGNFIETALSVPLTRTLTINGTSYDLTANRSWSVGTVTSVDLSVPTGFTIANNPITTSGTLAIAFASGYSLPTTSSQTNWDAAYNDKINSASVTGTTTKTLTLTQQDGGTITASWTDINTDAVTSVFGRTGAVVAVSGDYTTTLVTEGTNLYYTEGRVSANTDVAANTAARHNAVTLGTANGLSLSTQQLSLGLSSSSTNGALSSTDWSTFNLKQNAITLTTTGSSGSATFIGDTLNIPSYSVAGLGAVPDSRTITINGEVYDLSANRTFEVGDYGTF